MAARRRAERLRALPRPLPREARRRRMTVSQLVRNLVEDAFELVDGVVADVDQIVSDSMTLARSVRGAARRLTRRGAQPAGETPGDELSHVCAWSEVVLQRAVGCGGCGARLPRGRRAFAGLSDEPGRPAAWLCPACVERLQEVAR
jgi:hypothetical protein